MIFETKINRQNGDGSNSSCDDDEPANTKLLKCRAPVPAANPHDNLRSRKYYHHPSSKNKETEAS